LFLIVAKILRASGRVRFQNFIHVRTGMHKRMLPQIRMQIQVAQLPQHGLRIRKPGRGTKPNRNRT
jgi:hypothetical protein